MNAYEEGQVILIDKPLRWTSADVVKKIRNQIHTKVGHAGTLDPLAIGLLILCTGKFTKKINEYMLQEKEYTGTITLGSTTASFDLETPPQNYKEFSFVDATLLDEVSKKFTGEIMQIPPIYSAIKKDGERSYDLARQGRAVTLEGRKVFIKEFEMQILQLPVVHFRVVCSTGTYIRSLANDIGETLGCGGHLSSLCRTRIGIYKLDDALSPEAVISKFKTGS
jgi:tRNA pseudouridine55 synthase